MAGSVGFEPTEPSQAQEISNLPLSATQPTALILYCISNFLIVDNGKLTGCSKQRCGNSSGSVSIKNGVSSGDCPIGQRQIARPIASISQFQLK